MPKATIYNPPASIKAPSFSLMVKDMKAYREAIDVYYNKLKEFCLKRKQGKEIGKIIRFPVADGYAEYMVANLKPIELIHINIGDAYNFPYVQNLTAADIREEIRREEAIQRIFAKAK